MAELYVNIFNNKNENEDPSLSDVDESTPLKGEEVSELIKLRTAGELDYTPTYQDFLAYNEWSKNQHFDVMQGMMEGGAAVLGDIGTGIGKIFTNPIDSTTKFAPSLVEAFMQGTRNLYGMVAQSQDPNSVFFKFKNALTHDGTEEGYNQFLEALDFNKDSADYASGKKTILVNKDYVDHDLTLAMSYIADPTLFIPFGSVAGAGVRALGMGEKLTAIGARVSALKAGVMGGTLKLAGNSLELVGGATRAAMDKALEKTGNILETATGMQASELRSTARVAGLTGVVANTMGAGVPVVSGLSGAYVASGTARGFGEAIGALGEQYARQGGKRGFNSFATEALRQTPNLTPQAQKFLKALDTFDPMFSYSSTIAGGMGHGALIGGTLGYLNAGEEGMAHGIGAGVALGGIGAGLGRMYADYTGGTMTQRAEIHGTFVLENLKNTDPEQYASRKKILDDATAKGDRSAGLQIIAGLDKVAPNTRIVTGTTGELVGYLKTKGFDVQGYRIDPNTGLRIKNEKGEEVQVKENDVDGIQTSEGGVFTLHTEKVNGNKQITIFLNTESTVNTTYHHELFHAIFRETVMKDYFKNKLSSILLGEYENGKKIKNGEVTTNEFRNFAQRYYEALYKDKEGVVDVNKVNESMRQLDVDLSEWENAKKAGKDAVMGLDGNKQEGNAGRNLDYFVEEFGAYYFTQMMKGKPLDYLFRGGKIEGVRGAMYALKNSFLDFFESRASYQNPESKERFKFENGKLIDTSFGEASAKTRVETGKGGKRVRIGAIDYLMEDLVRATASQRSTFNSTGNYIDIKTWTPEARQAFFEGRGADGLKLQYDKNGQRVSEAEEKLLREEHGRKIFESLKALDPSLVKDGTISGTLSEAHIEHLVNSGLISRELGDRILHIQEIVSNENVSNVLTHDYHGITKEKSTDVENPERFRGNEVPVTSRESIVFGFEFSVDEKGKTKLIAHSLDKKVIDSRANQQWSNPEVRALFGENREAFDKAFIQYIENASKDASDKTRVESALLPLLEVGDGKGALRRNVMHQVAGFKKKKNSSYLNTPLEEIKRNARSSVQSLRIDLMSNVKVESTTRFNYNDPNAFSDLSRNFKPSDMKSEETLNGTIYKHQSGSSALKTEEGMYNVYNSDNKLISKVKTEEEVASVLERNFNKEKLESDKNIKTGIEIQRKKQANFKVIDSETRAEAEKSGSIFNTQWGKEFTSGTKVIPQTREEFILSSMIKLRQSNLKTVVDVFKAKSREINILKQQLEQAKQAKIDAWNRHKQLRTKASKDLYDSIDEKVIELKTSISKYDIIDYAVRTDEAKNANGQHILDVLNNLRENGEAYRNVGRMLFGDIENSQYQTGKPITVVATHGTNSDKLLKTMEFDSKYLGENGRHGDSNDSIGAFLAGSEETSRFYSEPSNLDGKPDNKLRQVRALVKMENPLVIDVNYRSFDKNLYKNIFDKAKAGGHDGVVIQNVYDGGSPDTVYVAMSNKLKSNTAIIDTVESRNPNFFKANRPSTPRGTVSLAELKKGSFKVSEVLRKSGFDDFLDSAKLSGRLIENANSMNFAGRAVVIINYDNTGVWKLTDSVTNESLGDLHGGAMHNLISGQINPDNESAVLASVNNSGLKKIEEVRNKAFKKGHPLTFLIVSGKETKSLSNPQVGQTVTKFVSRMLHLDVLSPKDLNDVIVAMSEARKKNSDGVWIPMGKKLKGIIGKSPAEQISFLTNEFFPQERSTFNERGSTLDRLIQTLAETDSVQKSPDFFRKFFGNEKMKMTGKAFKDAILNLTDDPMTRNAQGESIGYGNVIAALEVPNANRIKDAKGGHTGFPVDYRSIKPDGTSEPAIMSIFETPRRIIDMLNRPSNKDIGTHYKTDSGEIRSTGEMIMNTTSTFGEGVVKEGSHEVRPDTPESEMLTKEQIKGAFKVSEEVKRGVSAIDSTIAKINKRQVVSGNILIALDDFKDALRKQDATDEIVVKEVEETHSALLDVLNNEIKSSSNASKPYLLEIKKKVESLDRRLENNSNRINTKIEKQKQKRHESLQRDLDEGADLDAEEMLAEKQRKEDARIDYQSDLDEGADIESEQLIEESNKPEQVQPLEQPINQRDVWRRYVSEKTPNGSITKNSAGFSIILNGTKLRVYNPQNALLGIYTDIEQAKRRVQREEPKQQ